MKTATTPFNWHLCRNWFHPTNTWWGRLQKLLKAQRAPQLLYIFYNYTMITRQLMVPVTPCFLTFIWGSACSLLHLWLPLVWCVFRGQMGSGCLDGRSAEAPKQEIFHILSFLVAWCVEHLPQVGSMCVPAPLRSGLLMICVVPVTKAKVTTRCSVDAPDIIVLPVLVFYVYITILHVEYSNCNM